MGRNTKEQTDKQKETEKLHDWFREIWDEREDESGYCYCFETGRPMHGSQYRSNSCVYDHVLEKGKYKQYKYVKKNIVIILPEVHFQKSKDVDKTPRIKKYRNKLLKLHQDNTLRD